MNVIQELRRYGIKPSKKKAQHFLIKTRSLEKMADYAELCSKDTVLEIGCGIGNLTAVLLKRAGRVIGIEIDERFIRILEDRIKSDRFHLIKGDFLKIDPPSFDKCVSNIPYSISSPVIFKLVDMKPKISVLTLQKEFAERLVAEYGNKTYGRISAVLRAFARAEILDRISRNSFYPRPEVDSAIVRIIPEPSIFPENPEFYLEFTKIVFSQRRKKIKNLLKKSLKAKGYSEEKIDETIRVIGEYGEKRAEQISPEKLAELSDRVYGVLYG